MLHIVLNEFNSDKHRTNWTNENKIISYKIDLRDVHQQQRMCDLEACKVKLIIIITISRLAVFTWLATSMRETQIVCNLMLPHGDYNSK